MKTTTIGLCAILCAVEEVVGVLGMGEPRLKPLGYD